MPTKPKTTQEPKPFNLLIFYHAPTKEMALHTTSHKRPEAYEKNILWQYRNFDAEKNTRLAAFDVICHPGYKTKIHRMKATSQKEAWKEAEKLAYRAQRKRGYTVHNLRTNFGFGGTAHRSR